MNQLERALNVVVDGVIFQRQAVGGIPRLFAELIPAVCEGDPSTSVRLITSGRLESEVPRHDRIKHVNLPDWNRILRPRRVWRSTADRVAGAHRMLAARGSRGRIWHSTYYTVPSRWHGVVGRDPVRSLP